MSLRCHPDRVDEADKETATQKFQALGKAYSILSDRDKRAVYDETGKCMGWEEDVSLTGSRDPSLACWVTHSDVLADTVNIL